MKYTVYLRTNLVNGKQYVGQSKQFTERQKQWNCLKYRYANYYLTEERNKYGLENFKTEVLAEVETRKDAWELEQKYIKELDTLFPNGYNKSEGGKTSKGYKHSDEQKEKWSEIRKGKHNSPKTEFKKGLTPWIKGKHHTGESKDKNRLSHLGKISKKRKPIIQLSLDWKYIKEFTHSFVAAKELGFKSGESIRKACNEEGRTSGGYRWMYKDEYEKMLGVCNP